MSLRIFSALAAMALLAACGPESPEPEGDTIACAIGKGAQFANVCTLERVAGEGGTVFLVHAPDGSFRRLRFDPAKGEFGSVDGADALEIIRQDGKVAEFTIAADRYRIPHALVRGATPKAE
jgi:hypothetical protein